MSYEIRNSRFAYCDSLHVKTTRTHYDILSCFESETFGSRNPFSTETFDIQLRGDCLFIFFEMYLRDE